ncbi:hypothetical protein RJ45_18680 [Photobacterium gaetbulicola]|uniref:Uncharacterized protein n=1 Tax=Photobacterium gaetbulicola TaxID=1295392 RepID=A0A0B9GTV5_9GAMM|nr:hypothetical protein [Photobacterium gaetbulicola]KHT62186.1 hypothetical protein RJ45_18680 [Photobacterium gaetbulicola]
MQIKQTVYLFFYHLRAFFELTFKPLLGLLTVGLATSTLLLLSPHTQVAGSLILVGCIATMLWITLVRYYYAAILKWTDTRKDANSVINFPHKPKQE